MSKTFEKNQLLVHNTWGECIALRPWNDHETVCLVTRTGRRHILADMFLRPVLGPGPCDNCICVIDEKDVAELESRLSKAAEGNQS